MIHSCPACITLHSGEVFGGRFFFSSSVCIVWRTGLIKKRYLFMHCDCLFALEIAELLLCSLLGLLMMYGTGLWENVRWERKHPIEELKANSQTNWLFFFLSLNNGREVDRVSLGTYKPLIKTKWSRNRNCALALMRCRITSVQLEGNHEQPMEIPRCVTKI